MGTPAHLPCGRLYPLCNFSLLSDPLAVLIQIRDAYKSYGDQVLLDGAEATLVDDVNIIINNFVTMGKRVSLK